MSTPEHLPYLKQLGSVVSRKVSANPLVAIILFIILLTVIYYHWEVTLYLFLAVATSIAVGIITTYYFTSINNHGLTNYEQAIFGALVAGLVGFGVGKSAQKIVTWAKNESNKLGITA